MPHQPLTIWTNYRFPPAAEAILRQALPPHVTLVKSPAMQASNLVAGATDPTIAQADIALGQPDPAVVIAAPRVKWVHLTSAGYDRYDRPEFRQAMRARGGILTHRS